MANTKTATKSTKKGNYSQPGIHPEDKVDASGHKAKFDRGDIDEDKTDIIQSKVKGGKPNTEQPIEYTQPGIHSESEKDASGHKKKFDRAAPEENPDGQEKIEHNKVVYSESSKPNYVEQEAQRHKESLVEGFSESNKTDFLSNLVIKAEAGGWKSPIIDEIKHRIEYLSNK